MTSVTSTTNKLLSDNYYVHTIPGEWSGLAHTERGQPYSLCKNTDDSTIHERGDGLLEIRVTEKCKAIVGCQEEAAPGR